MKASAPADDVRPILDRDTGPGPLVSIPLPDGAQDLPVPVAEQLGPGLVVSPLHEDVVQLAEAREGHAGMEVMLQMVVEVERADPRAPDPAGAHGSRDGRELLVGHRLADERRVLDDAPQLV